MPDVLRLQVDKASAVPLSEQIYRGIAQAIEQQVLSAGARLPSWLDLAAQLGVARGTVRVAYEKLGAAQLVVSSRSAGTRVAQRPAVSRRHDDAPDEGPFMAMYREMIAGPAIFQMGIPSREGLPAKLLNRIRTRAVLAETSGSPLYPDPRGEAQLRREIAAYLAVARGLSCSAHQVIVTGGYSAGLGVALRVLGLEGRRAWMEDPGFPFTRQALRLARLTPVPVPVDAQGLDVDHGMHHAPDAALVVVTPGQQAPLGGTLSLQRRLRLLDWAAQTGAWIIEDDYLGELQLHGRAAPALASQDQAGRVIHVGSFSKTINPKLRLGFIVAPDSLLQPFAEVAACLAPAPGPAAQLAMAEFMREGHYLRHLRRTKRLYLEQGQALLRSLRQHGLDAELAALAALVRLPHGVADVALSREAFAFGLAPAPLSVWHESAASAPSGLLLGVATAPKEHLERACDRLAELVMRAPRQGAAQEAISSRSR
ncbi:PLP-dependent aminotransferase family protein [Caldimonas sp. KR1-144]|uniref:MocR-like pyridoxine biosynthesis transcription factor PdxR n=1 Tax=Caldimonas sp. KR1-144 TaxID=3400911 RepID=UPI003C0D2A37